MKNLILAFSLIAFSTMSFAHEGHDNAPGSFKSLHGGTVQPGKQLNLEVIVAGKEITLYPTSHEGKDVAAKDVKIDAIAKPKKGKPYPLTLTEAKGGYTATVDLKGANRVPVTVNITNQGKTDHFTFQVEE